jgi:hypothetical protein
MLNVDRAEPHLTLRPNQGYATAYFQQLGGFYDAIIRKVYLQTGLPKNAQGIDKAFFAQTFNATVGGGMGRCIIRAVVKMLNPVDRGYAIVGGQQKKRQKNIFLVKIKVMTGATVNDTPVGDVAAFSPADEDVFVSFRAIPAFPMCNATQHFKGRPIQ